MNRTYIVVGALSLASVLALTQNPPAQQAKSEATAPAAAAQQPQTPAAAPAPLPGRKPAEAKSQPEYDDYKKLLAITDFAQLEAATNDFATKYPTSELRELAYNRAMMQAQQLNQPEKVIEFGEKIQAIAKGEPISAMMISYVLEATTRETDLDKDRKLARSQQLAQVALENVDNNLLLDANETAKNVDLRKAVVRLNAYMTLADVAEMRNDWPAAEKNLRLALAQQQQSPDPLALVHLAIVLDRQKKYTDAISTCDEAMKISPPNSVPFQQARQERDRLMQLTGAGANSSK